jgi:glutamate racemase
MDNRAVGVFDSGVGGLTVVKALREVLPYEDIVYIGDTARVPYGTRSPETIEQFALEVLHKLLEKEVKLVVVACNTVSATSLPQVVQAAGVPVIGVIEPTVQAALRDNQIQKIGVIGTPATIKTGIYQRKIAQMGEGVGVMAKATPLLVPIVEEGYHEHEVATVMVAEYLGAMKEAGIQALILGCTHYPALKTAIAAFLGDGVRIIDSAEPTAVAVKERLEKQGLLSDTPQATQIYFTSDSPEQSMRLAEVLLGETVKMEKIEV